MAVVGSNLTNGTGSSASSFNTASITPGANNLILLTVVSGDISTPNVPTATGNSLTWVQVNTQGYGSGSGARVVTVLRAMGASPTNGVVTISFAGQSQAECRWSVDQFTGTDVSGTNGSGAIVQSQVNSATASSLTVTLSALGNANNASFGAFGGDGENGAAKGTNYTLLATNGNGANLLHMLTEYRAPGDTTPNWSPGASSITAGIGIEIKAASTGSPPNWPILTGSHWGSPRFS